MTTLTPEEVTILVNAMIILERRGDRESIDLGAKIRQYLEHKGIKEPRS